MHILHVITSMSPADGGPPKAVRELVEAYIEIGDGIEVACQDQPGEPYLANIPCPVHALGPAFLGRYGLSPRLWRWLHGNAHRFDGIVMNGIWTFPGLAISFAAVRAKKPYGVFVHGALDPVVQPDLSAQAPEEVAVLAAAARGSARCRGGLLYHRDGAGSGRGQLQSKPLE